MPDGSNAQAIPRLAVRFMQTGPASLNADARTVDCIAASVTPVERAGWRPDGSVGGWLEVLDLSGADLSRFIGGPVLKDHLRSTDSLVGTVEAATANPQQITARLRFGAKAAATEVFNDVQAGICRAVSLGYLVGSYDRDPASNTELPTFIARQVVPLEVSVVPIGADPTAIIRSFPQRQEPPMPTVATPSGPSHAVLPPAATVGEIRALVAQAGLPDSLALDLAERSLPMPAVREAVIDAVAANRSVPRGMGNRSATPMMEAHGAVPGTMVNAMTEAVACRMMGTLPSPAAREFMGAPLVQMARSLLEASGENCRWWSPSKIVERAAAMNTTSDFPNLLQGAGQRVLQQAYEAAQSPLRGALSRVRTVTDFRSIDVLRLGEAPQLRQVPETGEIERGTTAEAKESYRLTTFARLFTLSRQAIINDDLGAFGDWNRWMGASAAETEAQQLALLLAANAGAGVNLLDGKPMFDASRANTGAGVLTLDNLSIGRKTMRKTRSLDGVTPIAPSPAFLLVSPDNETAAEQLVTQLSAQQVGDVNPFAGKLTPLVEPRLVGAPWYLFADPTVAPVLEVAYLAESGMGPVVQIQEGWETLGVEMRCVLDFGAGAIGWRGAYRSTGA